MPRFTGNSSQGSKPITALSLTLSWIPHCTPQKQQCVLTRRSASPRPCHPPGGVSWRWGPYCAVSCTSVCGGVVIKPLTLTLSQREGGTLNCAPSADAVAGRGNKAAYPNPISYTSIYLKGFMV